MKHTFYDFEMKQKVQADVSDKLAYGCSEKPRYVFKAKTFDGRDLTSFVSRNKWISAEV